jgi:DNA replication protein DnaC
MAHNNARQSRARPSGALAPQRRDLQRACIAEHYGDLATQAAGKQWSHVDSLGRRIEGAAHWRRDRATHNRLRQARFPVIKTLDPCRWDWPAQRNRLQVQHHFGLGFLKDKANRISLGGVGLGKTPLATALGYPACLQGHAVLLASAIAVINPLAVAKSAGRLKQEFKKYPKPALLILDELGYLPIDTSGADLLFQGISVRYAQGSIMLTANRALQAWPKMFNTDST